MAYCHLQLQSLDNEKRRREDKIKAEELWFYLKTTMYIMVRKKNKQEYPWRVGGKTGNTMKINIRKF